MSKKHRDRPSVLPPPVRRVGSLFSGEILQPLADVKQTLLAAEDLLKHPLKLANNLRDVKIETTAVGETAILHKARSELHKVSRQVLDACQDDPRKLVYFSPVAGTIHKTIQMKLQQFAKDVEDLEEYLRMAIWEWGGKVVDFTEGLADFAETLLESITALKKTNQIATDAVEEAIDQIDCSGLLDELQTVKTTMETDHEKVMQVLQTYEPIVQRVVDYKRDHLSMLIAKLTEFMKTSVNQLHKAFSPPPPLGYIGVYKVGDYKRILKRDCGICCGLIDVDGFRKALEDMTGQVPKRVEFETPITECRERVRAAIAAFEELSSSLGETGARAHAQSPKVEEQARISGQSRDSKDAKDGKESVDNGGTATDVGEASTMESDTVDPWLIFDMPEESACLRLRMPLPPLPSDAPEMLLGTKTRHGQTLSRAKTPPAVDPTAMMAACV